MLKIAGMCPVVHPLVLLLVLFYTHPGCLTRVNTLLADHFLRLAACVSKLIKRHYPVLISPVLSICSGVKDFMWEPVALIKLKWFVLSANLHLGPTIHYSHSHKWGRIGCETWRTCNMLVLQSLVRGWSTSFKFKRETVGYVLCLKEKKGIFDVCIRKIQTLTCLSLGYNVRALGTIEDASVTFVMLHLIGFYSSLLGNSTYSGTSLFHTSQQQYIVNFIRQKYVV